MSMQLIIIVDGKSADRLFHDFTHQTMMRRLHKYLKIEPGDITYEFDDSRVDPDERDDRL